MKDNTPRYVPTVTMMDGRFRPVNGSVAYPPGAHPNGCIIRSDLTALEIQTDAGSRWWGFDKVWINSELRMVAQGFPANCELRRAWQPCKVIA